MKCTPTSCFEHICESIKKEIADSVWRRKLAKQLDITETIEKLMKFEEVSDLKLRREDPETHGGGVSQNQSLFVSYLTGRRDNGMPDERSPTLPREVQRGATQWGKPEPHMSQTQRRTMRDCMKDVSLCRYQRPHAGSFDGSAGPKDRDRVLQTSRSVCKSHTRAMDENTQRKMVGF